MSVKQRDVFLEGEGDRWFFRNQKNNAMPASEDVQFLIRQFSYLSRTDRRFLEVGCSNGVKSQNLSESLGWIGYGIDPSTSAITEANKRLETNNFFVGSAENLPFEDYFFDFVFFAFCLYLVDRDDLNSIFAEAFRVLKKNGFIAILDFDYGKDISQDYHHLQGVKSYKENYLKYFEKYGVSLVAKESYSDSGEIRFENNQNLRVAISLFARV
jgi:ubiquinone/menaquinone biosynthesis C-methylase UbiE